MALKVAGSSAPVVFPRTADKLGAPGVASDNQVRLLVSHPVFGAAGVLPAPGSLADFAALGAAGEAGGARQ